MRIGIMGGTFDPIHNGHLLIAENAREQYGLDQVVFMPAGSPPHKRKRAITEGEHRLAMTKLAIDSNPCFSCSSLEIDKDGLSYTYETLEHLKKEHKEDHLFFIIGADSLHDFYSWKYPERIVEYATILAAVRDDYLNQELELEASRLSEKLHTEIYTIQTPLFQVSSGEIRERVVRGQTIKYLVPEAVEEYIYRNKLYLS